LVPAKTEKRKSEKVGQSGGVIGLKICLAFSATMEGRKKPRPLATIDRIWCERGWHHMAFRVGIARGTTTQASHGNHF